MATIITKNSSTASAAPAVGDLTKGELAVNVTDKKLYTKDNSAAIVKIVGSLGNQEASAVAITGGSIAGITDLAVADGGTGASSAADARTNLGVTATGADTTYAFRSNNLSDLASASTARTNLGLGTIATQAASSVTITGGSVTGITDITVADGGTGASTAANARTNLGAAASGANSDITSITGLTTALTVAQGGTGVTTSTGTGNAVLSNSPTLVTPTLGTPASATLTNATGLPISTGVSGLGTGVATALAVNVGSAGAAVVNGGALGTPSSGTATYLTGLPLSTGVTGTLPVANGGTGQTSYTDGQLLIGNTTGNTLSKATLTAGSNITITNGNGSITIASTASGSGDVVGPASSTDNAFARFDSTTGKLIQNSTGATLSDTGGATFTGSVDVAGTSTAGSNIKLYEDTDNGTNYVAFKAPDTIAANVTWTLPAADGTSAQVLQTNGSGTLSWATAGGSTSPAGSNTQVQYNNSGAFGASSNLTFNGTTLTAAGLSGPLNGTIGATTPSTGAFTTVTTSNAVAVTYDGKVGTAISARYSTSYSKLGVLVGNGTGFSRLAMNANSKAGSDTATYDISNFATRLDMNGGKFVFETAPSGTAGNDITFTQSLEVGKDTTLALQGATSNSGTGITFPATQSASSNANTLDDYEQGTFTPVIEGTTTAGTATYNSRSGAYTKIGNLVTTFVYIDWTSFNGTGNIKFTGFPFATVNTANRFFSVCFGSWNDVALTASNIPIGYVGSNSTSLNLAQSSTGTGTVAGVPVDSAGTIIFTFTYHSAD